MGLNWSEGLKAAGKGLGQMAGMKMQEADWKYKEIAQQNRQRFETEKQKNQQEFLSGETDRKLQHDLDLEEERVKREGLRQERQMAIEEQRWRQFEANYGLSAERTRLEGERVGQGNRRIEVDEEQNREELIQQSQQEFEEQWGNYKGRFDYQILSPEQQAEADQAYETAKVLKDYLPSEKSTYNKITGEFPEGMKPEAVRTFGKMFLDMDDEKKSTALQLWNESGRSPEGLPQAIRDASKGVKPKGTSVKPPPKEPPPSRVDTAADGGGGESAPRKPEAYDWAAHKTMSKDKQRAYQASQIKSKAKWKSAVEKKAKELAKANGINWNDLEGIYGQGKKIKAQLIAKAEEILMQEQETPKQEPEFLIAGGLQAGTASAP